MLTAIRVRTARLKKLPAASLIDLLSYTDTHLFSQLLTVGQMLRSLPWST
jgi:hypothetical protein